MPVTERPALHSVKLINFQMMIRWGLWICFAAESIFSITSHMPIQGMELEKFKSCLANTKVDLSLPTNRTWWYDSQSVYVPVLRHPIAIAYAETTSQVQDLVKCATKHHVKISPRSGGHSSMAFSNADHHLIIDVSRIDFVNISDDRQTSTVGPGVRLGRLYYELGKHQLFFPAGECSTIGLGGHVGSGGYGFHQRQLGLAADNVIELEMVDWRGMVLVANNETNQELFFALRGGGGGSYGLVTRMKLKIYKNPPLSTGFTIQWNKQLPASDFCKALFKWKPWDTMPPEMGCDLLLAKAPYIIGLYAGEDGHLGLQRILNESGILELGPAGSQTFQYFSSKDLLEARAWLDNLFIRYNNMSDYHIYNTPSSFILKPLDLPPYPNLVYPTWKLIQQDARVNATHPDSGVGTMGPILNLEPLRINHDYTRKSNQIFVKEFDEGAYEALEQYVSQNGSAWFIPSGGKIYMTPADFNAYPHRRHLFLIEYQTTYVNTGSQDPNGQEIQINADKNMHMAMEPYTKSYQGNPDVLWTNDPKKYMPRYYGDHVERLVRTKVAYDPNNFFSNEQSTPLAL